jgi:hypothetical protein
LAKERPPNQKTTEPYYIDTYGVHDVEFQHGHVAQDTSHPDPAFFKEPGKAVAFAESIGFKGFYTIEVNADPAIRIVCNTILANIA